MNIKHFSVSNVSNYSFSQFVANVNSEIKKIELDGSQILDVVFDPIGSSDGAVATATVYFIGGQSNENFDIQQTAISTFGESTKQSLWKNNAQVSQWIEAQDKDIEIYDVVTRFTIDDSGRDIVVANIYFDTTTATAQ